MLRVAAYDALYRLTTEARTGANPYSSSIPYDTAGNPYTGRLVYDNANKLVAYDYADGSSQTYSYDLDGNLNYGVVVASYWFWSGDWSEDNKLTSVLYSNGDVEPNSPSVNYGYGADGLRKWSQPSTNTTPTFYIYSGSTLIGEVNASGAAIAAHTWGAAGLVSEHRFATTVPTTQNAQSLWYSFGPQGETRALTNSAGAVADTYVYYAYGYPIASTGSDPNPFRYGGSVGYYTDPNAEGLVLCGQRWYSPAYARWLSRDPEGYGGGANLYAYCGDNPVGGCDPDGTDPLFGFELHHWWPLVYGGPLNGPRYPLPIPIHRALTQAMQIFMGRVENEIAGNSLRWSRCNPGRVIQNNVKWQDIYQALKNFYAEMGLDSEIPEVKAALEQVAQDLEAGDLPAATEAIGPIIAEGGVP